MIADHLRGWPVRQHQDWVGKCGDKVTRLERLRGMDPTACAYTTGAADGNGRKGGAKGRHLVHVELMCDRIMQ